MARDPRVLGMVLAGGEGKRLWPLTADRAKPAWFRELPQNSFLFQVSGVGGTTQHYFGNCPRAYPGVFSGYDQPDRDAYDTAQDINRQTLDRMQSEISRLEGARAHDGEVIIVFG